MVRKSSARAGSTAASSPSTRAGTSARWSAGRPSTDSRSDRRTASAPRHQTSGPASRSGGPRAPSTAARSGPSAGDSRPEARTVAPSGTRRQLGSAMTSTGAARSYDAPRPVSACASIRTRTWSPNRPRICARVRGHRPAHVDHGAVPGQLGHRAAGQLGLPHQADAGRRDRDQQHARRGQRRAPRHPPARPGEATREREPGDGPRRRPEAGARQQVGGQPAQPRRRAEQRHPQVGDVAPLLVGHVRR